MGKERTWEQLQKELETLHKEMAEMKTTRLKDLEEKANEIGYTLVPVGQTARKSKSKASGGVDRDAARAWLESALKNGPQEKTALQKAYRDKFEGSRLRLDGWVDLLKTDAKGNVLLK